jgi:hypothetical protein
VPSVKSTSRQRSRLTVLAYLGPRRDSAVLHNSIKPIWTEAEKRLADADHLVIFGYSCPALDFESSNMLRRSQLRSTSTKTISLVDPDAGTATSYVDLLRPSKLSYYPSAAAFLTDHPH